MPNLKIPPINNPKFSAKPKTSAFHQFGDTVSRTQNGVRPDKIFGSINAAIKNRRSPDLKPKDSPSKPRVNSTFKPVI